VVLRHPSLATSALLLVVAFGSVSRRDLRRIHIPSRGTRGMVCPNLPSGAEPDVVDPRVTAIDWAVSVTPRGGSASAYANTSGNTVVFQVQNTGGCQDTYTFSPGQSGTVGGVSLNPTSSTLPAGFSVSVTATFSVGAPGTGVVSLSAQGVSFNSGSYNVTVPSNGDSISTLPTNGDYRDVTKCVANCFDKVVNYTTAPYFSADLPHSVQLVYRSSQAHPMGVVQLDAKDTSSVNPVKMSIQLKRSDGTSVTFTNGSTEIFYSWVSHPADGNINRLAAQFDSSGGLATGAHNYTAVVRSYRSDGSFRENSVPVRILIANEATSAFGAGWSMVGLQRGYLQADGSVVITEGNGSVAYFTRGSTSCNQSICTVQYSSQKGDFTTFKKDSIVGASVGYERDYPAGPVYTFDASLKMTGVGGFVFMVGAHRNLRGDPVKRGIFHIGGATLGYNASNLLVAITDSTGQTTSLGYDASNHLRWIKDPGGRVDSIIIDGSGNLSQAQDWAVINNQGAGGPVTFQYDANHRLVHWTDRRNGAWGVTYDFAGKVSADTAPLVTANGQSVRPVYGYASAEQKVLINPSTGQGTSSNPGPNVDTTVVRATLTNAKGYTTTYALDRFGAANLVQQPLGRTMSFTRDSNSAIVRTVSPSGHSSMYTWSGPDMTKDSDNVTGRTINYVYVGHHLAIVSGNVDSMIYHWTGFPLHIDSSYVGGSGWTKDSLGSDGRVCQTVDPGGHRETCFYTSTRGFQNTDSTQYTLGTVRYQYDGHGQPVTLIDQLHHTTRIRYDSIGRQTAIIGPLQDSTSFVYDGLYLSQVVNAKGHVYKYSKNALGWVDSTTDLAGKVDRYQYDLNGNRTGWTNRNGQAISFSYDSLDNLRSVVAGGKTTTLFFDPAGQIQVASDSESTDTLRFDTADRLRVVISCRVLVNGNGPQCFRDSSAYEIRDLDTLTTLSAATTWGSGAHFIRGHHYDVHELLDALAPARSDTQTSQPITFVYSVEGLDSIRTFTGLNNLTMTHSYPWTHRTDQVQLSDPTLTAAIGTAYNFDSAGRMATRYHGSLANPDTTRSFSYGPRGDLVQYTDTSHHYTTSCVWIFGGRYCNDPQDHPSFIGATTYAYDSLGNRKDPSAPNGGLDSANHLLRWQTFRMDYDAAGHMTVKRRLSATDTNQVLRRDSLFWSVLGLLDSVRTDSSGIPISHVGFGYDGWGRRVRKSNASGTNRYLWNGNSLLAQLDTLGNDAAVFTYYPEIDNVGSVLRHDRGDSSYYYVQDHSRNVLALLARTSSGVTIDNQYRYDPYGNLQGTVTTPIPNALQFAGREYDSETQLYYDRARYIDPALGRFVSEDPTGLNGGINLYTFVGNDPVNGSDPSGGLTIKGDNLDVELCGGYQEPLHFALEHLIVGWGLVSVNNLLMRLFPRLPLSPVDAVYAGFAAGIIHEGRWWDGDLTRSPGAPCNGVMDTYLFMIVPLVNTYGWSGPAAVPTQYPQVPRGPADLQGGSPIPGVLPGFYELFQGPNPPGPWSWPASWVPIL
jgi:RHS repeat-associated protein